MFVSHVLFELSFHLYIFLMWWIHSFHYLQCSCWKFNETNLNNLWAINYTVWSIYESTLCECFLYLLFFQKCFGNSLIKASFASTNSSIVHGKYKNIKAYVEIIPRIKNWIAFEQNHIMVTAQYSTIPPGFSWVYQEVYIIIDDL